MRASSGPRSVLGTRWSWESFDRYPWARPILLLGVAASVPLAVFGPPPIDLHGVFHHVGVMDPLCGATRGVIATLRGRVDVAFMYNPASPALAVAALLAVVRFLIGAVTGRWLTVSVERVWPVLLIVAVLLVPLTVNQQVHASLLKEDRTTFMQDVSR